MGRRLQEQRQTLAHTVELCRSRHPLTRLLRQKERLAELKRRLQSSQGRTLENRRHRLLHLGERIRVLGPKTLLSRGLAMIYAADGLVTGIGGRTKGEELELHFADGRIVTEITRVEPLQS